MLASGCSLKRMALNQVGDALSGGGSVFASDNDPELVGDALPFSLKLMESVLSEAPRHEGLLTSLASGFAQYSYGWAQLKADVLEENDYDGAVLLRERAVKLYLRGRDYGLRGLEARYPGIAQQLIVDTANAVARLEGRDLELVYWTGMSWGGAIALSLDNTERVGELAVLESLMDRAYALDPSWGAGALEAFFVTYSVSRLSGSGDPIEAAKGHYERALELSAGRLASVHVAFAEAVAVELQDKDLFVETLSKALAIDVDADPENRLANLLYQRRAAWLLTRLDWLFL